MMKKYGKVALVAGASQGLGAAYSEALAKEGYDLILIARGKDQLEATAQHIREQNKVNVITIPCDLSETEAVQKILDTIGETEVDFIVYNAAIPYIGHYLDLPAEQHVRIASANMLTPLKMVHHFGSRMMARRRGAIVLMTSLAGLQGSGFIATYAATKAFNLVLAESLWYEWHKKGVDIIGCIAGATSTPNFINTKPGKTGTIEPQIQKPEAVVGECLDKIGKVPSFISGRGNRLASFFMRHFVSRRKAIQIISDATRKMYNID
jgi:short-subunit dehydrogenase